MSNEATNLKQKRVRRRNAWYGPLALVMLFLVVILIMSLFFQVKNIRVINASEYSDEQIIQASGLQTGTSLFFVDRFSAASLIFSGLDYMESVSIQREFPDTILIQAEGTAASVCMQVDGEWWLVDRKGEMLGRVSTVEAEKYPRILGLNPVAPTERQYMVVDYSQEEALTYLTEIVSAMIGEGILSDFQWLDMSNASAPVFRYQNRLNVYIGARDGDTAYRIAQLKNALGQISPNDAGAFGFAGGTAWNYSPE